MAGTRWPDCTPVHALAPLTCAYHTSLAVPGLGARDHSLVEVLDPRDYSALNYAVTKRVLITRYWPAASFQSVGVTHSTSR